MARGLKRAFCGASGRAISRGRDNVDFSGNSGIRFCEVLPKVLCKVL